MEEQRLGIGFATSQKTIAGRRCCASLSRRDRTNVLLIYRVCSLQIFLSPYKYIVSLLWLLSIAPGLTRIDWRISGFNLHKDLSFSVDHYPFSPARHQYISH